MTGKYLQGRGYVLHRCLHQIALRVFDFDDGKRERRDADFSMGDLEFTGNIARPGRAVMERLTVVIVEVAVNIPDFEPKTTSICKYGGLS